jgi:hypothetical protein
MMRKTWILLTLVNANVYVSVQTSTWNEITIIEQFYLKLDGFPNR